MSIVAVFISVAFCSPLLALQATCVVCPHTDFLPKDRMLVVSNLSSGRMPVTCFGPERQILEFERWQWSCEGVAAAVSKGWTPDFKFRANSWSESLSCGEKENSILIARF